MIIRTYKQINQPSLVHAMRVAKKESRFCDNQGRHFGRESEWIMDIKEIKNALNNIGEFIEEADDAISNANSHVRDIEKMLEKDKSCREHNLMMRDMSIADIEGLIEQAQKALSLRTI